MDNVNNPGGTSDPPQGSPSRESGDPGSSDDALTRRMDTPPGNLPDPAPYGSPAPTQGLPPQDAPYTPPAYPPPAAPYQPPAAPYQPPAAPYQAPAAPYQPPAPAPGASMYQVPGNYTPSTYTPGGATGPGQVMIGTVMANPPMSDPMVATIIEIAAGIFGFLGVGHMLSGRLVQGIVLLAAWWVIGLPIIWLGLPLVTCGFGFCVAPILHLGIPILSGLWLRSQMLSRPIFSR
ncbi:MAG TPA: hypothetical protein VKY74_06610 [Chloroflexia bacterium]|nr:hypothetical protein [Chloroflexia bacterium]